MPFSYLGKTRRLGGGPLQSVLPSAAPAKTKSISTRKSSRKRTALINFVLTNLVTIALSASLFFFLLTLFLFGVPQPISSRLRPSPTSYRRPFKPRKPISLIKRVNDTAFGAKVDVTTKDLYDKIEFLDIDGGPWKQGWRVSYKGNEWDEERLKVFLVPHSHNDPGWKLTVEEYYDRQSRHILDTIVESLSKVRFWLGFRLKLIR